MANSETTVAVPSTPTVKVPILPLLLCVVAAVLLAVGGSAAVLMWMARSGRLPGVAGASAGAGDAARKEEPKKPEVRPASHALVLEPLLANLADADAHAYLKLALVLQIEDPPPTKDKKKEEAPAKGAVDPEAAALRDSALDVMGREHAADLLGVDGKERLKQDLQARFRAHNASTKVADIFFTDFLVQQ